MKELKVAIKAAKESGKILMRHFNSNVKVDVKPDGTLVTIADRESEKKIVSIIKKSFPDHNFLCEEFKYKQTDSEYKWIIDPLDGTSSFVRGIPFFGNFIGLEKKGEIIAGCINMPAMKLFGYAARAKGAFVNGMRIKVSNVGSMENSFVAFGKIKYKYPYRPLLEILERCGSQKGYGDILGHVLLAKGSVDVVIDSTSKPWDIAAVKIIVEEAGGKLTDFDGNDTIYSGNSIATNGLLHDEVLKIFKQVKK